jgi:hypothetical protein
MYTHSIRRAVLALALGWLSGCGSSSTIVESPDDAPPPPMSAQVSLSELLSKSRADLAREQSEWEDQAGAREKAHREGSLAFALLPQLRLPLALPIWGEAHYSAAADMSLPRYLAEGTKDSQLALHLARYGDVEAARRLAEPGDAKVLKQIDACQYERNYPAEWTRLVALMIHSAEFRLATGDDEGRVELAALHRQLRKVLDPKAAQGPLGATLLARGHKVLSLAAASWREEGQPELAKFADGELAEWGEVPPPFMGVPFGASRSEVASQLRSQPRDHVIVALTTARALDLFDLPIPSEGARAAVACFDGRDRLAEVLVTYRPRIGEYFLEPSHFALILEDHGLSVTDKERVAGVLRRSYPLSGQSCEVGVVPRGYVLGAFARFTSDKPWTPTPLARTFGAVSLDRTYEQDRLRLMPEQRGDTVRTGQRQALDKLVNPIAPLPPVEAVLRREPKHDLVSSFSLYYGGEGKLPPLFQVALPLWAACGPCRLDAVDDADGGHLALTWEDAETRFALRLPHVSGQPFAFEASDRRGPTALAERAQAAAAGDRAERKARLEAGKPLTRIPRQLEVGWTSTPRAISLGMTREQVLEALPRGQSVVKTNTPDAIKVLFTGEPRKNVVRVPRQAVIRFGPDKRVAEIRVRYFDGPASSSTSGWTQEQLAGLLRQSGAASEAGGSWAEVWSDFPAHKPAPRTFRWQDDATLLTYQRDGAGAEAILRDCPAEHPNGVPLPPLATLPRGPEGCALGEHRAELLRKFKIDKPVVVAGGALVLPPPKGSPFDAILVWFDDDDKAARIVARYPASLSNRRRPNQLAGVLMDVWGSQLRDVGWPRRQDHDEDQILNSLGFSDDLTRTRIFWQEADDGQGRIFMEWKAI